MLIKFLNEDTSWVYNSEAIVALVGERATKQFRSISLSGEELKSSFPLICFDTPSKKDFRWVGCEKEIDCKVNDAIKKRLALCQTDMLFVLSDLEREEDIDTCVRYAEQIKEKGSSFLVTHTRNRRRKELVQVADKFYHVIFVENDTENLFYPVKQLLVDYYCSVIGIDMADIKSIYPNSRKTESYFVRYSFANMDAMKAFIPKLQCYIKARADAFSSSPDFMIFIKVSQTASLEDIDKIADSLVEDYAESEVVCSYNFNSDADDNCCILLLQTVFPNYE